MRRGAVVVMTLLAAVPSGAQVSEQTIKAFAREFMAYAPETVIAL